MLKNLLNDVLGLPHITNGRKRKHEKKIQELLKNHNFKQTTLDTFGLTKAEAKDATEAHKGTPMTFVAEPCGTQSFPDFLVCDHDGECYYIECKSSKQDKITWNSGTPKANAIYIFSSGKYDKQTLSLGVELWTPEDEERCLKARLRMKEICDEIFDKECEVYVYPRPMHIDRKKVYGHPDRRSRVEKVFNHIDRDREYERVA